MIVIYKITNPFGRIYIGQTRDYSIRLRKYKRLNCKNQRILYNSLLKYGFEAHTFEIIESVEIDELNCKEIFHIRSYMSNNNRYPEVNGMNCNDGGGYSRGFKHTEETKLKLSQLNDKGKNKKRDRIKSKLNKKSVIDTVSNKTYTSVREAANDLGMTGATLSRQLNGIYKNRTNLVFIK